MASRTAASKFSSFGEFDLKKVVTMCMHSSWKGSSLVEDSRENLYLDISAKSPEDGLTDGPQEGLLDVCEDCC